MDMTTWVFFSRVSIFHPQIRFCGSISRAWSHVSMSPLCLLGEVRCTGCCRLPILRQAVLEARCQNLCNVFVFVRVAMTSRIGDGDIPVPVDTEVSTRPAFQRCVCVEHCALCSAKRMDVIRRLKIFAFGCMAPAAVVKAGWCGVLYRMTGRHSATLEPMTKDSLHLFIFNKEMRQKEDGKGPPRIDTWRVVTVLTWNAPSSNFFAGNKLVETYELLAIVYGTLVARDLRWAKEMSVAEYRPNLSRGYCRFHTYNKKLYTSISCMYVYFIYIYILCT